MDKKADNDIEQAVLTIGRGVGRPKGSKTHLSKAMKIRREAKALRQQGLSCAAIAERLGVCRNTVIQALRLDDSTPDTDNRQIVAFIRRQLRMMQSIVNDSSGDTSRYTAAFQLLDTMEQRM